jgi:formate-dependent nitrite reductase membrane component NrfD
MVHETVWTWPIVAEQFLFGLAGGGIVVAAALSLWGRREEYRPTIRYTYVTSAIAGIIGLAILVFELGRPERAPNAILNLLRLGTSVMSWTVPLLGSFVAVAVVGGGLELFLPGVFRRVGRPLEALMLVLAVGAGLQAGLLLQASTFRAFWQSPVFPYIYLITGILGGIGLVGLLLARNMGSFGDVVHALISYGLALTILHGLAIASHVALAWNLFETRALLTTLQLGLPFYLGTVLLGIVAPGLLSARVVWSGAVSRGTATTIFTLYILGLLVSRVVYLFAGQLV